MKTVVAELGVVAAVDGDDACARWQVAARAFELLDVSLRVPLSRKADVYFAVENVTDAEYVVRLTPIENLGAPRVVHGGIELRLFR